MLDSKILVVEDNLANIILTNKLIKNLGYKYLNAENGQVGLEMLQKEKVDLVLLDLNMPVMNGIEMLKIMKDTPEMKSIPVIVITSETDRQMLAECIQLGSEDFLNKPYDKIYLEARINSALEVSYLRKREQEKVAAISENNKNLENIIKEKTLELTASHQSTITAIAKLCESRDMNISGHGERVAIQAVKLAHLLKHEDRFAQEIDDEFLFNLQSAAIIYDIGRIAIPDSILSNPGKLTKAEEYVVKKHPEVAAGMIRDVLDKHPNNEFLKMAFDIAAYHHEHCDGTGYPKGLKGSEIPLSARIICVCDAYDALTSGRPYRREHSHEKAVQIITQKAGIQFCPNIADVFIKNSDQFNKETAISSKRLV